MTSRTRLTRSEELDKNSLSGGDLSEVIRSERDNFSVGGDGGEEGGGDRELHVSVVISFVRMNAVWILYRLRRSSNVDL